MHPTCFLLARWCVVVGVDQDSGIVEPRDQQGFLSLCPNESMYTVGCFMPILVFSYCCNHVLWKSSLRKQVFILAHGTTK